MKAPLELRVVKKSWRFVLLHDQPNGTTTERVGVTWGPTREIALKELKASMRRGRIPFDRIRISAGPDFSAMFNALNGPDSRIRYLPHAVDTVSKRAPCAGSPGPG